MSFFLKQRVQSRFLRFCFRLYRKKKQKIDYRPDYFPRSILHAPVFQPIQHICFIV